MKMSFKVQLVKDMNHKPSVTYFPRNNHHSFWHKPLLNSVLLSLKKKKKPFRRLYLTDIVLCEVIIALVTAH